MKRLFTIIAATLMALAFMGAPALAVDQGTPDTNNKYTLGNDAKQWKTLHVTGASAVIFEGATGDAYETTISVTDPTADNTITVPNLSGTLQMKSGTGSYVSYALDTDNVTLTTADCGETHAIATDAKVYTLPSTVAGCMFTFVNAGAAANNIIAIDPTAADQIFGSCATVDIAGAAGEKLQNTKGTSIRGDSATIVGDGADGWYITACNGVWAEESP